MKSLMKLWQLTADDMAVRCRTSTTLDFRTVQRRVDHEGLSFFTITLPAFGSDFETSLARGKVTHDQFLGFSKAGGLPRFLGGFLELVFDRHSGQMLDLPCVDAVFAVRQLTKMYNKLLLRCSDSRETAALHRYIEHELDMAEIETMEREWLDGRLDSSFSEGFSYEKYVELRKIVNLVMGEPLGRTNTMVYYGDVLPKHGPGATADGIRGNSKFAIGAWTRRLEDVFPMREMIVHNDHPRNWDVLSSVPCQEPGSEMPCKVTSVPKTLKTPRIIAVEPTHMMYVQQGISEILMKNLMEDELSSRFINFKVQELNQQMALEGSLHGELATLDLSEASDSVSNTLVKEMFAFWPDLLAGMQASRSLRASVLGKVINLTKFASMGSALTFPVECIAFLAICFLGIQDALQRPLTRKDITSLAGKVRVYGDDIIVPVEYVPFVIERLESFGFRVNSSKSFWTGSFRESCGKEYFAGKDVSIVRVRRLLPTSRNDAEGIISLVSLRNQLYNAGLWGPTRWLDEKIRKLIPFPIVEESSPIFGRTSVSFDYVGERECKYLHRPLVQGMIEASQSPKSHLDGLPALLKFFLKRGVLPNPDKKHLERQGRPVSVSIKKRWATPY